MSTISQIIDSLQNLTNAKISQSDIARALGVTRATINARIKSKSQVTFDEIKKLEEIYQVSLTKHSALAEALMSDEKPYSKFDDLPYKVKVFLLEQYNKNINLNWLVSGQGPMHIKPEPNEEIMKIFEEIIEEKLKERGL